MIGEAGVTESSEDKKNEEKQGFKVNDRRRFEADGTARAQKEPASEAPGAQEEALGQSEAGAGPSAADAPESSLPAEFSSLLLSLAGSAQSSLGIAPHPMTGKVEKNLPQAKHAIDLLGVLEEKTKGNLSSEEAQLLQALLYDLRMRYVEAQKEPDHEKK